MEQQLQQERIVIENDDEIEIDLKDLVLEILSFWKWVLFALIIGAVTAYCISRFVMVPQYESTSQFYVLSKSMSITSLADIQTGTSLTNDYMVIVEGRPVLEQVIENLGLDETYSSLKKKVTLNNPSNSRILEITVRDANPSMAKRLRMRSRESVWPLSSRKWIRMHRISFKRIFRRRTGQPEYHEKYGDRRNTWHVFGDCGYCGGLSVQ